MEVVVLLKVVGDSGQRWVLLRVDAAAWTLVGAANISWVVLLAVPLRVGSIW